MQGQCHNLVEQSNLRSRACKCAHLVLSSDDLARSSPLPWRGEKARSVVDDRVSKTRAILGWGRSGIHGCCKSLTNLRLVKQGGREGEWSDAAFLLLKLVPCRSARRCVSGGARRQPVSGEVTTKYWWLIWRSGEWRCGCPGLCLLGSDGGACCTPSSWSCAYSSFASVFGTFMMWCGRTLGTTSLGPQAGTSGWIGQTCG